MASIYVAASYAECERALAAKKCLEGYGLGVTSSWLEGAVAAGGKDPLLAESPFAEDAEALKVLRDAAAMNDSAIEHSDIVLVLASDAARETIAEARLAIALGKLVVWVGWPRPLSAYRPNVLRFADDGTACAFLWGYAGPMRRERNRSAMLPSVREEYERKTRDP
jgi:hypothetical protein